MPEPFLGSEALTAGKLTRHQLRSKFRAIHEDVYLPISTELTPVLRAQACWLRSRRRGVLAGFSASALHGAKWISNRQPAEIIDSNRRRNSSVIARECLIEPDEICERRGMRFTVPARTALDLLCWHPIDKAVAAVDSLARATRFTLSDVLLLSERYSGRRAIRKARAALELVDPGAESPRETSLRLLVVRAGFPPPKTQLRVLNEYGVVIAELDMGWQDLKIGLEYDGDHHRTSPRQFARDIHRHEVLKELGWDVLRITAQDVEGDILRRLTNSFGRRLDRRA